MATLTIIILTKNEASQIRAVVQNALQTTADVLVVDSGSTDQTVELARATGARVAYRAWDNDFAAQRNFGLTQTTADWVLYLDADERLNPDLVRAVAQALKQPKQHQYSFTRKSVAFGAKFEHGVLYPDQVARLFPRQQVQWVGEVHEHPECPLPLVHLPGYVEHYTYSSWQQWEKKLCQYTTIWAEDAYKRGKRISLPQILAHSIAAFVKMFVLKLGFLDGWLGIYMCCNHFFYTLLKYLKLYDLQRRNGGA